MRVEVRSQINSLNVIGQLLVGLRVEHIRVSIFLV